MEFLAPAKVNLSLRVKRRRSDGYHEIETLICPIALFDRLEIELRDHGGLQFMCSDPRLPCGDENLVVRAATLFCAEVGVEPHLNIALTKEIPHGAGLAGGSSDAATTLLALDALFQTMLPRETLASLAADLGSDVPVFIHQSAAECRGRGELVEPRKLASPMALLLVKPPFGVRTPWAYSRWADARELPEIPYQAQLLPSGELVNDLERPVFEKHLFLAVLKRWLLAQPEVDGALMSGSGSTIFAVLKAKELGFALGERLGQEFGTNLWVYLCETLG